MSDARQYPSPQAMQAIGPRSLSSMSSPAPGLMSALDLLNATILELETAVGDIDSVTKPIQIMVPAQELKGDGEVRPAMSQAVELVYAIRARARAVTTRLREIEGGLAIS